MKKRPSPITFTALSLVLGPVVALLATTTVKNLTPFGECSLMHQLSWPHWLCLMSLPVTGVGVYRAWRWGWYLVMIQAVLLLSWAVYAYRFTPNVMDAWMLVSIMALAVGTTGLFFTHRVYAPFFNPRLRWWQTPPRYGLRLEARLISATRRSLVGRTRDISRSGCFLQCDKDLTVGEQVCLSINGPKGTIACLARVVREAPPTEDRFGYGIVFQGISRESRRYLQCLLKAVDHSGASQRQALDAGIMRRAGVPLPRLQFQGS